MADPKKKLADMDFVHYARMLKHICDEELERMSEFLHYVDKLEDASEDKYYIKNPRGLCPPDMEVVQERYAAWLDRRAAMGQPTNIMSDLHTLDARNGSDEAAVERAEMLYEQLRDWLFYGDKHASKQEVAILNPGMQDDSEAGRKWVDTYDERTRIGWHKQMCVCGNPTWCGRDRHRPDFAVDQTNSTIFFD